MPIDRKTMCRAFLLAVCVLPAFLPGQVDRLAYRHWAWMEQQRRTLLTDLLTEKGRDEAMRKSVAELLTENDEQLPLLTIARAIAKVRGTKVDAGFLFRAGVQVYALPEVIVKDRELAVTVHAPYSGLTGKFERPDAYRFELTVRDEKGKVVKRGKIKASTDYTDLREFRSVCKLAMPELPQGIYTVEVDAILDGAKARAGDVPLRVPFTIDHRYVQRAHPFRLVGENTELINELKKLDPLPRAILQGVAEYASRAWFGVPGVDPKYAGRELAVAERVHANLAKKVFPLRGLSGTASIGLPAPGRNGAEGIVLVTLRTPKGGLPDPGSAAWQELAKRPLVLVMPGVPRLDCADRRPSFPHYTLPVYPYESLRLAGFDKGRSMQLAVVESPGRMPNTAAGLKALLENLPKIFPFDPNRIVLVGEGHGGAALASLAEDMPQRVKGLVLVNSTGSLASPGLDTLAEVPILVVPGRGVLRQDALERMRVYEKHATKRKAKLEILAPDAWPWSVALPLASPRIEAFAKAALTKAK